eukprot:gene13224-9070_t
MGEPLATYEWRAMAWRTRSACLGQAGHGRASPKKTKKRKDLSLPGTGSVISTGSANGKRDKQPNKKRDIVCITLLFFLLLIVSNEYCSFLSLSLSLTPSLPLATLYYSG